MQLSPQPRAAMCAEDALQYHHGLSQPRYFSGIATTVKNETNTAPSRLSVTQDHHVKRTYET